jgi:ubiquinone/menaquinone biosynthesis C-methylase UbiE
MTTVIDCRSTATKSTPDLKTIKSKQRTAWSSGDYALIGATLQIVGERLAEAMDLRAGQTVLDIAAGNGNITLAAARRWCEVTSTDYVQALLDRGRKRAEADGLNVDFRIADAEYLPFETGSFDVVVSTFGAMFSPDQDRTASEMLRVCKSGGKIGLANWTPGGFIGRVFKIIGKYLRTTDGVKSPLLWGTQEWLELTLGALTSNIMAEPRMFNFRYRSPQHFLDFFRAYYGPMLKAFEALDASGQKSLARDLIALIDEVNMADDGTMVVPGEYLQIVATRR